MATHKRRVLCVEDDADTCEMLAVLLGLEDFEVNAAQTVAEGLAKARGEGFDLILLDNRLPDGTGVELCRRIREFDLVTPIIFISASAFLTDRVAGLGAGANAYLAKPVEIAELMRLIRQLLPAV